jgi:hypothetical protein
MSAKVIDVPVPGVVTLSAWVAVPPLGTRSFVESAPEGAAVTDEDMDDADEYVDSTRRRRGLCSCRRDDWVATACKASASPSIR